MAQYRATIKGSRGEASRLGSVKSGMVATVNGWHTGVWVEIGSINGRDTVTVVRTGGSGHNGDATEVVASWTEGDKRAEKRQAAEAAEQARREDEAARRAARRSEMPA